MLAGKAPATRGKLRLGVSLKGWLLALPTNIKLSLKGLQGTDTLAYYEHSKIADLRHSAQDK
jgi:hypothetical protein